MRERFTFLEFFAGGGMARLGLGAHWRCVFANDFDPAKRAAYGANFGLADHHAGDVHQLALGDLPEIRANLAWASSPCQDLSLAGARRGLAARRSGAFFGFWRLIEELDKVGRAPNLIVVENVAGLLTSNGGRDFSAVASLIAARGYLVGACILDAADFVPQSRPRLFILGAKEGPPDLFSHMQPVSAPRAIVDAGERLPAAARKNWRWIRAHPEQRRNGALTDIIDESAPFDPPRVTRTRLAAMAPHQRAVVDRLVGSGKRSVGAAFRRIRVEGGAKRARIEARFDGVAGCVRTPGGGSSRQIIFIIDNGKVWSRLMTPREAARAMGLPEDYRLPATTTAALAVVGDGVAPPVVRWLAENVLERALGRAQAAA